LTRDVAALAKSQSELAVIPCPIRQLAVSGKRKAGTFVSDDPVNDPVIAAIDKNVSNGFAQFEALGNREKMVLALGCRVLDKIIIGQLLGAREHGSGDFDDIVEGKRTHQLRGCAVHAGQTFGKLRTCLDLDIGGQTAQHIVEQRDLFVRIVARAGGKQIGNSIDNS